MTHLSDYGGDNHNRRKGRTKRVAAKLSVYNSNRAFLATRRALL